MQDVLNTYKSKFHGIKALSKYKEWFPLKASPELAGIVADLIGDGHLQGDPKWRLDFCSNSVDELKRFETELFNIFKIRGKNRKCTTNTYGTMNYGINCKPLARELKLLKVPTGAKVLSDFSIPKWILESKDNFAYFINRLFSCEGTVDLKYRFIEIKMYKSVKIIDSGIELFETIKFHLENYFQIKTTNPFLESNVNLRKDGNRTKAVRLKIKKKDSLIRYKKYIGFDNKDKSARLNKISMSYLK
ncbi:hypothetical protein JXB41_02085 [Candidatus Woesearchaeota archaeon]|nr:hypothetical protein [Candidatus Woesearchaeota archaeon]